MDEKALNVIKQILVKAREERIGIMKTRLIKLLYLAEVEYYRVYQKRLTNLVWKFYHFGAYPPETEEIFSSPKAGIEQEEIDLSDGKTGFAMSLELQEFEENYTDSAAITITNRLVKEWGTQSLNNLLDHVYFETEPMRNAKRGDILDFTTIKPFTPRKPRDVKISRTELDKLRRKFKEIKAKRKMDRPTLIMKESYFDCIKIWDEGTSEIKIKGDVNVDKDSEL